mmetsp:Transcript_12495/g.19785  ORF Transcript_12495/g.19785 Transcript_12495/m.19785 type:complete len:350 (+) Transcript_12495:91-1140(+)
MSSLTCDCDAGDDSSDGEGTGPEVALRNSSTKALQCRTHSAVDVAVFYGSRHHRTVKPVVTELVTLLPDEKCNLQADAVKGNVFFVEVLNDKGDVLEKYGRPDPFMPFVFVHDGEFRKTLKEMTSDDGWEIQGEPWGDPGALRNFTADVFECRVFESEDAEATGVTVRVLPWQGFNSFCQATRIEVLDGSAVKEIWETDDGVGFKRKGVDEDRQPDDSTTPGTTCGIVSRLEPQNDSSYHLNFLHGCDYKMVVHGDKHSVEKEKTPDTVDRDQGEMWQGPVWFEKDDLNWFGILDDIYDNLASPGTSITVEVSCSAGKDIYEIELEEKKSCVFSLSMKAGAGRMKLKTP